MSTKPQTINFFAYSINYLTLLNFIIFT